MLDVHPPHQSVHTWSGFFIHIATIAIGLLIALGLEQTVEYFHHRHQVAETREALRVELEGNRHAYAMRVAEFHRQTAALNNNMTVLQYVQQHPGTAQEKLPGILVWHAIRGDFADSAWRTAQQSNVTALMPQDEVRQYAAIYDRIGEVKNSFQPIWAAIIQARLYSVQDPDPSHLSSAQLAEEIGYTKDVMVQHFASAAPLVQLNRTDPSFTPGLSKDELNLDMHVLDTERDPKLAHAIERTNERLPKDGQMPIPSATP